MKDSLIAVAVIFLLIILGCNLPEKFSKQGSSEPPPPADSKNTDQTKELKDEVAELRKELERQKQDKIDSEQKRKTPSKPPKGYGRVNSPRDGFLAFRSEPSANRGVREAKIPHGTTLKIYYCDALTVLGGRRGRWCQVLYKGKVGWVFDAYLIR